MSDEDAVAYLVEFAEALPTQQLIDVLTALETLGDTSSLLYGAMRDEAASWEAA